MYSPLGAARPRAGGDARARRRGGRIFALLATVVLTALTTGCQRTPAELGGSEPGVTRPVGVSWTDPAALLPATDLGPGWRERATAPEQPRWPWEQADCPAYRAEDYRAQVHRLDAVQRFYDRADGSATAHHIVEAYEPGWGGPALDDVRAVLRRCAGYLVLGARMSFTLVGTPPLADGALLVRGLIAHSGSAPTTAYFVVVRRGDTISTLNLPDPGHRAAVEAVAARQVARLG
ncbi:hypothetical protein ACFOOK_11145 [Micromonospora krabiensis]|uniref:PknH-like extracellular domain-containing protein n=1 Tax=Micromonospora krabiensis TaxID=307121 RepID=A0A1C3NA41_9ACTN|nr:hypothetical protein [Micromonospora krabiensis]SBV29452.1 hypothetical protein GA0070620_5024 [Micromonospora krabiensis]